MLLCKPTKGNSAHQLTLGTQLLRCWPYQCTESDSLNSDLISFIQPGDGKMKTLRSRGSEEARSLMYRLGALYCVALDWTGRIFPIQTLINYPSMYLVFLLNYSDCLYHYEHTWFFMCFLFLLLPHGRSVNNILFCLKYIEVKVRSFHKPFEVSDLTCTLLYPPLYQQRSAFILVYADVYINK